MDLGLKDKVVFVAGASRGIGKGIASVFLDEGARVAITGRNTISLSAAAAELSSGRDSRVSSFAGDLSDTATVQAAHRWVTAAWGPVNALICNIGSGTARNGWRLTAEDWDPVFRINLWATARLI